VEAVAKSGLVVGLTVGLVLILMALYGQGLLSKLGVAK
jgi:hypothetical protein